MVFPESKVAVGSSKSNYKWFRCKQKRSMDKVQPFLASASQCWLHLQCFASKIVVHCGGLCALALCGRLADSSAKGVYGRLRSGMEICTFQFCRQNTTSTHFYLFSHPPFFPLPLIFVSVATFRLGPDPGTPVPLLGQQIWELGAPPLGQ